MFKVLVKPSASILKCKDFMVAYRRYSTAQSKLTVLTQSSRLDPCVLKLERFEFCDARIESQVSGFEFWEARFLLGINFVFLLHIHAAIQKFAQMISDCSVAFFNIIVWIACFGKLLISLNQYFWFRRFILHIQYIFLESRESRREWLSTYFWAVLYLHMRIKPQESSPCRCPNTSAFWKRIYCMQFLSYNILYILE